MRSEQVTHIPKITPSVNALTPLEVMEERLMTARDAVQHNPSISAADREQMLLSIELQYTHHCLAATRGHLLLAVSIARTMLGLILTERRPIGEVRRIAQQLAVELEGTAREMHV